MEFLFEHIPQSINGDGKVESVTFKTPNGEKTIQCGLVISAIGYQPNPSEGLPIDGAKLVNQDGFIRENLYVVGWAKRGPSGVIGTNKSDAAEVMKLLLARLPEKSKPTFNLTNALEGKKVVTQSDWEKINSVEIFAGEALGKPRLKLTSISALLNSITKTF